MGHRARTRRRDRRPRIRDARGRARWPIATGESIAYIWSHIKPKADARYPQNPKTIVVSDIALAGQHETQTAMCPDGWQALGGGVDPNNVLTMSVTSSGPIVAGDRTLLAADSTYGKVNRVV